MAISIGIFGAFPPDEADGFNTMRCWQHSFAVADLMALFIRERDPLEEGTNHLVGLCHDLGEILLRQHFTAEYDQILEFAVTQRLPIHAVESTALGIRHPELLSRLKLSHIGLPLPIVQAIREFFERQVKGQAAGMTRSPAVWAPPIKSLMVYSWRHQLTRLLHPLVASNGGCLPVRGNRHRWIPLRSEMCSLEPPIFWPVFPAMTNNACSPHFSRKRPKAYMVCATGKLH